MGFALDPAQDRSLARALRAALLDQVEDAESELRGGRGEGRAHAPGELDEQVGIEAVHETRKALKRARTVLRLLRRAFGIKRARNEARALGGIARQLAAARDARILQLALARLLENSDEVHVTEAIRVAQATQGGAVLALADSTREKVLAELRAARERLGRLRRRGRMNKALNKALRSGLRRMLRRIRTEHTAARKAPTAENFHALRRRCKDFYYVARLLEELSPDLLAPRLGELDRLGVVLGEEHDLAVLLERLKAQPAEWGGEAVAALLEPLIERERQRLRAEAEPLVAHLVALRPRWFARAVVKQLRAIWGRPPTPAADTPAADTNGAPSDEAATPAEAAPAADPGAAPPGPQDPAPV